MMITTRDFGDLEILEENIINFKNPIFAFENFTKYVIIDPIEKDDAPLWLQSVEEEDLCFIAFRPTSFIKEYRPHLTIKELTELDATSTSELMCLAIAVVNDDIEKTTINLKSPVMINPTKKTASQIVLEDDYEIKYPLFKVEGE